MLPAMITISTATGATTLIIIVVVESPFFSEEIINKFVTKNK